MSKKKQEDINQSMLEKQLEDQLGLSTETETATMKAEEMANGKTIVENHTDKHKSPERPIRPEDTRALSVGEWMITILVYILPIINIIMAAVWAFSSVGNINRRNFSRAFLLWIIILLFGYVVAMTVAGYTIFDVFSSQGLLTR